MSRRILNPKEVEHLKREANRLKKADGLKQHEALDRIAIREGYRDWRELATISNRTSPPPAPPMAPETPWVWRPTLPNPLRSNVDDLMPDFVQDLIRTDPVISAVLGEASTYLYYLSEYVVRSSTYTGGKSFAFDASVRTRTHPIASLANRTFVLVFDLHVEAALDLPDWRDPDEEPDDDDWEPSPDYIYGTEVKSKVTSYTITNCRLLGEHELREEERFASEG